MNTMVETADVTSFKSSGTTETGSVTHDETNTGTTTTEATSTEKITVTTTGPTSIGPTTILAKTNSTQEGKVI